MAYAADRKAVIAENLKDAGLDEKSILKCIALLDEKQYSMLKKILADHRKMLLDNIHKYTKYIDCLDYFIYTTKKSMEVQ